MTQNDLARMATGSSSQRRKFLQSAAAAALGVAAGVKAQPAWPSRAVHIIVPFSAGGATDVLARILGQSMESTLKQTVVVENKVGATGTIAANYVAKAAPDGYTALFGGVGTNALLEFTMPLTYNPQRDFVPAGNFCFVDFVMAVGYDSPYRSLDDLLKDARARPGEVSYQSAGPLGTLHIAQEYLWKLAKVKLNHVPYKGESQVIPDLVAGRVSLAQLTLSTARQLAADKKVRMLATMAPQRLKWVPDLPTVAELGFPGFAMPTWNGVLLPAGTPAPVVKTFNDAINAALRDPAVRKKVEDMGIGPDEPNTPEQHAAFLKKERERWQRMVRESGVIAQ